MSEYAESTAPPVGYHYAENERASFASSLDDVEPGMVRLFSQRSGKPQREMLVPYDLFIRVAESAVREKRSLDDRASLEKQAAQRGPKPKSE